MQHIYDITKWQGLIDSFLELNTVINLSSLRTSESVWTKHILDSLELIKIFDGNCYKNRVDVGTGSGFPLLPLAKMYPGSVFTGIESIRKKADSVNRIAAINDIQNARVQRSRIEEWKGSYDVLTARAVAYSDVLINRSYQLVKKGGYFIFYKMFSQQEHDDLIALCKKRSLTLEKEHHYTLFEGDVERVLYILKKQ